MAETGGVELDEFDVFKLQPGLQGQCHTISGEVPGV